MSLKVHHLSCMGETREKPGGNPNYSVSKRGHSSIPQSTGLFLHDVDSLSTVDSEEAGGDKFVSLSRQFKDRVCCNEENRSSGEDISH
jgi:hypothetical protein